ncbi:hypothetical protein AC579_9115 [Pseudocercospora musae]|uniref:Uncharacterized protein n=1 Tax=Pseudocercospora musae TaxID=113226 RepID=A0A139IIU0_9PEZI|nr:hypothetical protein AC579_9115 [Pseudocercospora musae]
MRKVLDHSSTNGAIPRSTRVPGPARPPILKPPQSLTHNAHHVSLSDCNHLLPIRNAIRSKKLLTPPAKTDRRRLDGIACHISVPSRQAYVDTQQGVLPARCRATTMRSAPSYRLPSCLDVLST